MSIEHRWNETDRKRPEAMEEKETHHIVTLSTTIPTKKGLVMNLGLRGERPGTNSLNHGTGQFNMRNNNM